MKRSIIQDMTHMKILNPADYIVMEIDAADTARFEAFLDRNFLNWRDKRIERYTGISRAWYVHNSEAIRHALFRKDYVELYDEFEDPNDWDIDEGPEIIHMKNRICDINGDQAPVALWGEGT
ncbi:MAG: hypothetical protein NTW96_07435 [Planctomycetia bacterium]|nr:hypothetical protein [Planctomycetia bacterium]